MAYKVRRSAHADADLETTFEYLFSSFRSLGDSPSEATAKAASRIRGIGSAMRGLALLPHQGTQVDELAEGLRRMSKDRAILYFVVDDANRLITVVGIYFGGQDHLTHITKRMDGD